MLASTSTQLGLRLTTRPLLTSLTIRPSTSKRCLSSLHTALRPSTPQQTARQQLTLKSPPSRHLKRHASTTTNPPPESTALDWNSFFRLRTSRRYYSLTSSLIGLVASATGTAYFLTAYPDQSEYVVKLIPMDPIISTGIAITVAMLGGWLLGPIFGNGLWRVLYRKRMPEFTVKERAFFDRIKKHRVNPAGASTNNPVPDFYGEKIGSVSGYRRWLKDQRAFNRKRGGNFVGA